MSLADLTLQDDYRSSTDDLVDAFYIPCLTQATRYDRAVGYFTSASMALVARGLTAFIQSGGKMRLVTSPHLTEDDVAAIAQGLKQRDEAIADALLRELETELSQILQDRLEALVWLLSKGLLEIKLAVPRSPRQRGIYHEKIGVFADADSNLVTFAGSANETEGGLIDNFEYIEIFTSWETGVQHRALRRAQYFEELWTNQTPKVQVMDFPDAVAQRLIQRYCPSQPPTQEPRVASSGGHYQAILSPEGVPRLPAEITLRSYQQAAIANWFKNKGRGTLKMATGSGKTITALAIAAELYKKIQLQAVIIVCPYRHLVSQWAREYIGSLHHNVHE